MSEASSERMRAVPSGVKARSRDAAAPKGAGAARHSLRQCMTHSRMAASSVQGRAFIGLGANIDDPLAHLMRALRDLEQLPSTRALRSSGLYRTAPVGPTGQPDYVNAVARLDTRLSPLQLLQQLMALERLHGRVRNGVRWGPRPLDLDLLLYDNEVLSSEELTLPHPRMHEREFVLRPLHDLAPDLVVPGQGPVRELLRKCPATGMCPLQGSDA